MINFLKKNFSPRLAINLFIEFGPILIFFVIFDLFDFLTATIALVGVVIVAFLLSIYIEGRIAVFSMLASGSIVLFGGASIFLSNPDYLIFKDTLFWGLFGLIILGYHLKKILILKKLFVNIFDITDEGWRKVTLRWMIFSFMLALSNQIVLWYFTPEQWVIYKMIILAVLAIFSVWQFQLARKERNPESSPWGMKL